MYLHWRGGGGAGLRKEITKIHCKEIHINLILGKIFLNKTKIEE